ncbi:MAG: hypothetical protein ACHQK9_08930 [Reyranellales bacterium]
MVRRLIGTEEQDHGQGEKSQAHLRYKKLFGDGMKMRKEVLGSGCVDNSMAGADDFKTARDVFKERGV